MVSYSLLFANIIDENLSSNRLVDFCFVAHVILKELNYFSKFVDYYGF